MTYPSLASRSRRKIAFAIFVASRAADHYMT
jgi:hypothetical protein